VLATVGHDLRSPLQTLVSAAEVASTHADASMRHRFAGIVFERSEFFTRQLNDLLVLASEQSLSFNKAAMDLHSWLDALKPRYTAEAQEKALTFTVEQHLERAIVMFDRHRLTQLTDNLVANAIRYTNQGRVTLTIQTTSKELSNSTGMDAGPSACLLVITVTDTGLGIASGDQRRIFEPFTRLNTQVAGAGLGLSVVANIAQAAGGSIRVTSSVGQGTRFSFEAPCSVPEKGPAA
jgi:signal transduction histidine kinase